MSERPDPMIERLGRFTPSGIDRDAILVAAGRQSARGSRLWPLAAGLLVAIQIMTLLLLWPSSPAPMSSTVAPTIVQPTPSLEPPPESPPPDIWSAGSPPEVVREPSALESTEYVSSGPTLTVGSALSID